MKKKFQRVNKKDAEVILEKLIKGFKDPCQNADTYVNLTL